MRELKIRAWHKPYKQMCQVESLRFDGNGVYTAVLIEESFYDRRLVEADEIVIEQFTGLKDKNGTEIYEGDVVIYGELTYSVEYGLSRFMLCAPGRLSICLSELTYDCDTNQLNCEVIGDIHENPELLEEK